MTLAQIQSELGLTSSQARRHLADRRKVKELNRIERRKAVRRCLEDWKDNRHG